MNMARDGSLLLDPSSLRALGRHFDTVLQNIKKKITHLTQQSNTSFTDIDNTQGNLIDAADAEISKCHDIIREIDELELEFDRIEHIQHIVRAFRPRAEEMERALDSLPPGRAELQSLIPRQQAHRRSAPDTTTSASSLLNAPGKRQKISVSLRPVKVAGDDAQLLRGSCRIRLLFAGHRHRPGGRVGIWTAVISPG